MREAVEGDWISYSPHIPLAQPLIPATAGVFRSQESAPSTGRAVPTLGLLLQPGGLWEPTSGGHMCNPLCRG